MFRKSESNGNNSKMATEKKRVIKYKPISGRLHDHLGFIFLDDGNIKSADKVYYIHCDKSFTYIVTNRSHTL